MSVVSHTVPAKAPGPAMSKRLLCSAHSPVNLQRADLCSRGGNMVIITKTQELIGYSPPLSYELSDVPCRQKKVGEH